LFDTVTSQSVALYVSLFYRKRHSLCLFGESLLDSKLGEETQDKKKRKHMGCVRIWIMEAFRFEDTRFLSITKVWKDPARTQEDIDNLMKEINKYWCPLSDFSRLSLSLDNETVEITVQDVDLLENFNLGVIEKLVIVDEKNAKQEFAFTPRELEKLCEKMKEDGAKAVIIPGLKTSLPVLSLFCRMGVSVVEGKAGPTFYRRLAVGPLVNNRKVNNYKRVFCKEPGEKAGLIQTFQGERKEHEDINQLALVAIPYREDPQSADIGIENARCETLFTVPGVPESVVSTKAYATDLKEADVDKVWQLFTGKKFTEFFLWQQKKVSQPLTQKFLEDVGSGVRSAMSLHILVSMLTAAFNGLREDTDCYKLYGFLMKKMEDHRESKKGGKGYKETPFFPKSVHIPKQMARDIACYRSRILFRQDMIAGRVCLGFLEGNGRVVSSIFAMCGVMPPSNHQSCHVPRELGCNVVPGLMCSTVSLEILQSLKPPMFNEAGIVWLRGHSQKIQWNAGGAEKRTIIDVMIGFIHSVKDDFQFMTPPDLLEINREQTSKKETNHGMMCKWMDFRQESFCRCLASDTSEVMRALLYDVRRKWPADTSDVVAKTENWLLKQGYVRHGGRYGTLRNVAYSGESLQMVILFIALSVCQLCPEPSGNDGIPHDCTKAVIDFLVDNGEGKRQLVGLLAVEPYLKPMDENYGRPLYRKETGKVSGSFGLLVLGITNIRICMEVVL
jgi:hypothetical protein